MPKVQAKFSVNADTLEAGRAVAQAKGMSFSDYVEGALLGRMAFELGRYGDVMIESVYDRLEELRGEAGRREGEDRRQAP